VTDGQRDGQTPGNSKDRAYAKRRAVKITAIRLLELKLEVSNTRQEAQLMLRNPARRDIIRRQEKYLGRPDGHTALPLLSVFIRPKISKSTRLTGSPSR